MKTCFAPPSRGSDRASATRTNTPSSSDTCRRSTVRCSTWGPGPVDTLVGSRAGLAPRGSSPSTSALPCSTARCTTLAVGETPMSSSYGPRRPLSRSGLAAWAGDTHVLFVRASATALPIRAGSLGGVTCSGVLHLVADPEGAVRALAHAMRARAPLVCVATLGSARWLHGPAQQAMRKASAMTFFDGDRLLEIFERHGLTVTATRRDRMVMMIAAQNSDAGRQHEVQP